MAERIRNIRVLRQLAKQAAALPSPPGAAAAPRKAAKAKGARRPQAEKGQPEEGESTAVHPLGSVRLRHETGGEL
jgi:hypothetical protein